MPDRDTLDWLLDSDPALRWQVMRDLTDASPAEIAAERARIPQLKHFNFYCRLYCRA